MTTNEDGGRYIELLNVPFDSSSLNLGQNTSSTESNHDFIVVQEEEMNVQQAGNKDSEDNNVENMQYVLEAGEKSNNMTLPTSGGRQGPSIIMDGVEYVIAAEVDVEHNGLGLILDTEGATHKPNKLFDSSSKQNNAIFQSSSKNPQSKDVQFEETEEESLVLTKTTKCSSKTIPTNKINIGKTSDGKNIIGRIVKIEKTAPNPGMSVSQRVQVIQSDKSVSKLHSCGNVFTHDLLKSHHSKSLKESDSEEVLFDRPTKMEYIEINKTLMGLLKMDSIEKKIGNKFLTIKYIQKHMTKSQMSVKITKKFQGKLTKIVAVESFDRYSVWNLHMRGHRDLSSAEMKNGTENDGSVKLKNEMLDEEDDLLYRTSENHIDTVVISVIVSVDEYGTKKTKVIMPQNSGPYQCPMCTKVFRTHSMRSRHMNFHTRANLYPCNQCDRSYLDRATLVRHRALHKNRNTFRCDMCSKEFSTQSSHKRHITIHNPELRPLTCTKCPRKFTDTSSLKKHEKIHTGVRDYECDVCYRNFVHLSDLTFHRKIHDNIRPFTCTICGRSFSRQANLERHRSIHSAKIGVSLLSCDMCDSAYKFNSSLTRHILRNHIMAEDDN